MDSPRRSRGPVPLDELFDQAFQRLDIQHSVLARPLSSPTDGFIFSGNRHDSVPRALLLDKRLTPLERNAWQVFRLLLNEDGITVLPTYNQLAPWLASMPCAARASHETVARALTLLRLTRWLSLVRRRRDPMTGRIQGNLYVLHDEPLTPYEAIQLDTDYLELASKSLAHANKSVQRVGMHTLRELTEDPMLKGQVLPSRLQVLSQRLQAQGWDAASSYPQGMDNYDPEDRTKDLLRNCDAPSSGSEAGEKTSKTHSLRDPKADSTVRKKEKIKEVRTVPRAQGVLHLPGRFMALSAEQKTGALAALQSLDSELHQAILEEWDVRCGSKEVRNPAGYLFGIIQKAMRGEFHTWAGQKTATASRAPEPQSSRPVDLEGAQAHIARLRALLRLS
ncbi:MULTISPECIES: STY4528 family pathogenicity island replication protein [Sodalis]|uniref:Uncharacterized protein n=1 Tax=Sodalis ligni TaxID=2697027 RepID=A0A4R1N6P2_9GAMM|nr:STY4528 family pathogenicity island replication protein [Sodalis ligni]TCL02207.1 hypothetical protein EZJ58_0207 [Sodalis ligni]